MLDVEIVKYRISKKKEDDLQALAKAIGEAESLIDSKDY